jgi:beta-glucanase (GH16 family)
MFRPRRCESRLSGVVNFFTVLFGVGAFATTAPAEIPDVPGWELFWHDDFEGTTLDNVKWEALNRKDSFNNEKQYYHPSQVAVADGNLQLTAINTPRDGKAYQSGLITSRTIYGPGRFEARIDLPTTQGMWPAFWLNANQVPWPQGGEIDILENRGSQPTLTSSAFHWQKDPGPCCDNWHYVSENYTASSGGNPVNFHAGFHTYAAEWDTNRIRYFVDGNLHMTVNQTSAMSNTNFTTAKNIILNLAVGGNFGGDPDGSTVFPQTMLVDYVRLWHRQTGVQGDYNNDGEVTAGDYTVWRDSLGAGGIGLAADGSGNGTIGETDFNVWKTNFGAAGGSSVTGSTAVPEPHTLWFILAGVAVFQVWARYFC